MSSLIKDLSNKMRELEALNFLSPAAIEIINIIDQPRTKIEDLVGLVSIDRILYSNIFKYTSSAAFGLRRCPHDLNEAIHYLGVYGLRDLIFLISSHAFFKNNDDWYHNVFTAQCAKLIAYKYSFNDKQASQIYMAALIFDLGALILRQRHPKAYQVIDSCESLNKKIELENERFNSNRVSASYSLLQNYGLPENVLKIIYSMQLNYNDKEYKLENFIINLAYDLSYLDLLDEHDLTEINNSTASRKFEFNLKNLHSGEIRSLHHKVRELIRF